MGDEAPLAIAEGDFQAAGGPEELEEEAARTLGQPMRPGPEQVAAHVLTHLPFAPWCAHCVQSRGRENAHPKTGDRVDAVQATVCMDYFFLTDPDEDKKHRKATGDKTPIPTAVVAIDTSAGAVLGDDGGWQGR